MYVSFGVTSKITPSPTDFLPPPPSAWMNGGVAEHCVVRVKLCRDCTERMNRFCKDIL